MRNRTSMLVVAGLVVLAACATGGERSSTTSSRDVLTGEDIVEAGGQIRTAYEAVEQLRPHFLRVRANPTVGAQRADPVMVYVNGTRRGGPDALRQIRAEEVVRIRYVRPSDAQTRYGMGHGSGAIEVSTHGG